MSKVFPGRYSAETEESFVVFMVGMVVNNPLAVRKWLPVMMAMPPMINELKAKPELGMMSSRLFLSWPLIVAVQYWRSFEALELFARNPNDIHLPAWRRFNKAVGVSGDVGIYHETYMVKAGQYEAIYANAPRIGLASAFDHVTASSRHASARRRLGGENEPAVEITV